MFDSLQPHGLSSRLLCPRDSPGKNTGVGSHSLRQGIAYTKYKRRQVPLGHHGSLIQSLQFYGQTLPAVFGCGKYEPSILGASKETNLTKLYEFL